MSGTNLRASSGKNHPSEGSNRGLADRPPSKFGQNHPSEGSNRGLPVRTGHRQAEMFRFHGKRLATAPCCLPSRTQRLAGTVDDGHKFASFCLLFARPRRVKVTLRGITVWIETADAFTL